MSLGPSRAIDGRSRTPRDERIAALRASGWSLRDIGREVHLSPEQVRRILRAQALGTAAARDALRVDILDELSRLERHAAAIAARRSQLRRELRDLEEELQADELDELLGLREASPSPAGLTALILPS